MTRRVSMAIAATAIGLSLALAVPAMAGADSSQGSSHRSSSSYRTAVRVIDHQFLVAVAAAKHQLAVALRHATTPGQRSTARARYGLAIALASTQRDRELVDLGAPPKGADAAVTPTAGARLSD